MIKIVPFYILISVCQYVLAAEASQIDELVRKTKDANQDVRNSALWDIGEFGMDGVPVLITALKNKTDSEAASGALSKIGGAAVPQLIDALESKDLVFRTSVVNALRKIGPDASPGVPQLIALLESDNIPLVRAVTAALYRIGPQAEKATIPLTRLLSSNDSVVRDGAVRALGRFGRAAKAAIPELIHLLGTNNDDRFRIRVAGALLSIGDTSALPILISYLKCSNFYLAKEAAWTIEICGDDAKDARPELLSLLETPELGKYAAAALLKISQDETGIELLVPDLQEIPWIRLDAAERLASSSKRDAAIASVVELFKPNGFFERADKKESLHEDQIYLMSWGAKLLGEFGQDARAAIEPLRYWLKHSDRPVRDAVEAALKKIDAKNK